MTEWDEIMNSGRLYKVIDLTSKYKTSELIADNIIYQLWAF